MMSEILVFAGRTFGADTGSEKLYAVNQRDFLDTFALLSCQTLSNTVGERPN